jgi:uncharacterized membrane protein YhaH (DUF805 family)
MNFAQLLSFQGRQRRLHFWMVAIVIVIIQSVVFNIFLAPVYYAMFRGGAAAAPAFGGGMLIGWLVYLFLIWPSLANSVKRCHDRNKSGWWLVLYSLASLTVIGVLWPLIELGFMDGTQGPNKYGPSPKGVEGPAPAATATS